MAENCAAASRPGSARAHASDDNSGKSFRINIDLGCGPSPAYGPLHGTCSALLPAVRAMAKIMQGPQNTKRPRGANPRGLSRVTSRRVNDGPSNRLELQL